MKTSRGIRSFVVFSVMCVITGFEVPLFSQAGGEDVVIGKTVIFKSEILDRDVNLQVRLPIGYETSDSDYPVLYDLNAFFCFTFDSGTVDILSGSSDIPDMIVVGLPPLPNGYVPTALESRGETPSGADLSIRFLEEELIPYVEKNYRSNTFRILYGHSVGGLFTMYTLFSHPELFTAYIAGSPWFQVNDQYWLKNIDKMAPEKSFPDKFLFMTVGKQEDTLTIDTYKELEKWMNSRSLKGLAWKSAWLEGDHGSMVGRNIYDGLVFIFDGWKISNSLLVNADVDGIDKQIKTNTAKWGKYGL
ncbi:MAG: alpha/beta hydrolase, partial [Candidatus Aminicenantes bacterium]|nr:alpha/beta hydrolase [Candidatus Aminicenantes bacterium]